MSARAQERDCSAASVAARKMARRNRTSRDMRRRCAVTRHHNVSGRDRECVGATEDGSQLAKPRLLQRVSQAYPRHKTCGADEGDDRLLASATRSAAQGPARRHPCGHFDEQTQGAQGQVVPVPDEERMSRRNGGQQGGRTVAPHSIARCGDEATRPGKPPRNERRRRGCCNVERLHLQQCSVKNRVHVDQRGAHMQGWGTLAACYHKHRRVAGAPV